MENKRHYNYRKCAICGVRKLPKSNTLFSSFPLDPDQCRLWVKATGDEDLIHLPIEKLHELKYLCGSHFVPEFFNTQRNRLVKTAVPTENLTRPPLSDDTLNEFPLHVKSFYKKRKKDSDKNPTLELAVTSEPSTSVTSVQPISLSRLVLNMDTNDNSNQSDVAAYLEITDATDVKTEPNEDTSSESENLNRRILLNLQKFHGFTTRSGNDSNENPISAVKRKNCEEKRSNTHEDRMSDGSNSSNVVVKRRRYSDSQCDGSVGNLNDILESTSLELKEERSTFTLYVTNTPGEWTSQEIIDYIRGECGINISRINDSREGNMDSEFQIKLKFPNKEQLTRVHNKLREREAEGKLRVHTHDEAEEIINDVESDTIPQTEERDSDTGNPTQEPEPIDLASDENAFYIREDYLESLGIKTPLSNWVTVTNFRCDKSELKEVLELAGKVLVCSVISISNKYANVMYSHPLEAVQAISMLNGQKLYGLSLKITMSETDTNILLPKGLASIGPGLGKYGKGLPDLVEQFKRFVKGHKSSIDANLFQSELLQKLGVDLERDCPTPIVRYVPSSNSSNHNDNNSEHGSESSQTDSIARNNGSQYGAIGQRMHSSNLTAVTLSSPQFPSNRATNFTPLNQPVVVRATNGNSRESNSPMPIPTVVPTARYQPVANMPIVYANCQQQPVERVASNAIRASYSISVIGSNAIPVIPGPMLTRPVHSPLSPMRGPAVQVNRMPVPNPFPAPRQMNTGPNVGPNVGPRPPAPLGMQNSNIPVPGPMRPNGPGVPMRSFGPRPTLSSNVQMYKGADPVTIEISNLPPSMNFVTLGQMLAEFGHVVFLELSARGRAVARFASPAEADRCLQNYRSVMG